ncbi:MAG: serine/threonine-protein kinase [Pirellulales bacterium]
MDLLSRVRSLFGGGKVDIHDRFELMREAVHGTMSKFYMARDRQRGEVVGLKILDPKKTVQVEKRFKKLNKPSEGQIASSLSHPSIVETFEYGITTVGEPYIVMEYLEGQGLNTLIQSCDQRTAEHRTHLMRQAAESLATVHEAGFVHRDICPRNFVVSADRQTLKLIDFGLTVPDTPAFRRPGNRTGTPRYMSPEIVRRRATDHRVDIFSFGVTAYELFAFTSPWPGTVATAKKAMEHDKPPIPITDVCSEIDPKLAAAIHACLSANPGDRPNTMTEFIRQLT